MKTRVAVQVFGEQKRLRGRKTVVNLHYDQLDDLQMAVVARRMEHGVVMLVFDVNRLQVLLLLASEKIAEWLEVVYFGAHVIHRVAMGVEGVQVDMLGSAQRLHTIQMTVGHRQEKRRVMVTPIEDFNAWLEGQSGHCGVYGVQSVEGSGGFCARECGYWRGVFFALLVHYTLDVGGLVCQENFDEENFFF